MAKRPKTGGRVKGTANKATRDIRAVAQVYTDEALATLAFVMRSGEPHAARVAASRELLDRGYGKPAQALVGGTPEDNPIALAFIELRAVEPK